MSARLTRTTATLAVGVLVTAAVVQASAAAEPELDQVAGAGAGTAAAVAAAGRPVEDLGRGVVAVRSSDTEVLVGWRSLVTDTPGLGFHVERSTAGGAWTRLTDEPLTGATNLVDGSADLGQPNSYRVVPVAGGEEQPPSGAYELSADHAAEPVHRVPIEPGGPIKFVWVGDLDGDGEYDYVVDRQTSPQSIEAYRSDGTQLWTVDLGPNSLDQDNIEGGSSTIDVGHWDGVTVADLDGDGRSEVALKAADGVTFGAGETLGLDDDVQQVVAILDGESGAALATAPLPDEYLADGPLSARFGVGSLDGVGSHLVAYLKNRKDDGAFNLAVAAWSFDGAELDEKWVWHRGSTDAPDGHNTRIVDVDGDGKDEVAEIGFVLNGDGTLRYSLGPDVVHGDRFHIADIDPDRPGLEGYGVQQSNPSGLLEYYYDADTGEMLWEHHGAIGDVGRGMAGDVDPDHPGMEVWSFSGLFNAASNELTEPDTSLAPWPQLGLWWDGDPMIELLNDGKIEEWDPQDPRPSGSLRRIETISRFGAKSAAGGRNPALVGDILGDWREEAVYPGTNDDELVVFTTDVPTDLRLTTLAQDPAYRNGMTVKGYLQSHHPSFYLGSGMDLPAATGAGR
jgi:rhamnogalacturonan endolyase